MHNIGTKGYVEHSTSAFYKNWEILSRILL